MCGFVIVNTKIHDEFDQFKKVHFEYDYSLLEVVELLFLWLSINNTPYKRVGMFGKQYIRLHNTEIDSLCTWVTEIKQEYDIVGVSAIPMNKLDLKENQLPSCQCKQIEELHVATKQQATLHKCGMFWNVLMTMVIIIV